MRICILQHDIVWANPAENMQHIEKLIDKQENADMYVLCEMWSTGFVTQPKGIAACEPSPSLLWMKKKAHERQAAIVGSMAVEQDGEYFNRLYFVKPDGEVEHYDKRHLFTYGGEDKYYSQGKERVIVEWKGVRFLLGICYDLRFPVWSRNCSDNEMLNGKWLNGRSATLGDACVAERSKKWLNGKWLNGKSYDAILYVANWPTPRKEVWKTLLRARAIENQCYVVGVNRIGKDPSCQYCGDSAIIDAYGHTLAECGEGQECCVGATLDMEALRAFRHKFPVLNDGEEFKIKIKS